MDAYLLMNSYYLSLSYYNKTRAIMINEIQDKAREILRNNPNMTKFVMGDGDCYFIEKHQGKMQPKDSPRFEDLHRLIDWFENGMCVEITDINITINQKEY